MQPNFTQLLTNQLFTTEIVKETLMETLVQDIEQEKDKKYGTPVAVIDLGTNICRLLIADKIQNLEYLEEIEISFSKNNNENLNFRILHQEKITTSQAVRNFALDSDAFSVTSTLILDVRNNTNNTNTLFEIKNNTNVVNNVEVVNVSSKASR